MGRTLRTLIAGAIVAGTSLVWAAASDLPVARAVDPVANPPIEDSCGLDVTLVLDASGSIQTAGAVDDVRNAAKSFLDALQDTDSLARVTQFASLSQQLAPATLVTSASVGPGGVLRQAVNDYYNPKPSRPGNVDIYRYDGSGDPSSAGNWDRRNNDNQYTNWDQGLDDAGAARSEIVVFITDGEPTGYDLDQPSDPFDQGPPPDVGINTNRGAADQVMLDRSIEEANSIKNAGTRMLAVGVGNATGSPTLQDRLEAISGPQLVTDLSSVDSLNEVDVAIVDDFDDLAQFLRSVVLQLCSPSLTITKLAQSADDASYQPAANWDITVTPEAPGGTFDWILPDTTPAASKTVATNANGTSQFQWEPDPPELDTRAVVQETLEPGYAAGRPSLVDYRCELRDEFGNVREQSGELDGDLSFELDPIGQEVVTCTIWNSFDYQPDIELTKVDSPTVVRGDLAPGALVTSTFEVTNPGNTPLSGVDVTDDRCAVAPVTNGGFNIGDTDTDGKLDTTETWQFTCTRNVTTPPSTDPAGQEITNNAETSGTDPEGTVVTDTATDTITAFNPAIELTKLVDGQDLVTVTPPAAVEYSFQVANTGNTPLGAVTLTDDTDPCSTASNIVREADSPGNDDDVLDVGETWNYTCDATRTTSVVNTATVEATPLTPPAGTTPFPDPNPVVTDTDTAEVRVINPAIELTKVADPRLLLLDEAGNPEDVTYTFTATNPDPNDPLTRPVADNASPKDPNWVTDPNCSPVTYVDGDTDGDDLLEFGETWTFTCGPVPTSTRTVNVATITGQPTDPAGVPIPGITVTDTATAVVDVLRPGIDVEKTALRPVVLDPDADPAFGPDAPTPRPADYLYEVVNTGNVELDLAPAPVDDTCAPLTFVDGDADADGLLDVDETWTYECTTSLQREQGSPPPTGAESAFVTNLVTVTGVPEGPSGPEPGKSVTSTDTAQVLVIEPALTLTKTPSADVVLAGDTVTYTFEVANTGDVGLEVVGPTDDKCSPLVFQGGDTDGNGLLDGANSAAAETWTYTCDRPIGLPPAPETADVNDASVVGVDPLGNLYGATATATVRVIDPAIDLVKTVSNSLVPVGTEVTYDFDVTNVGTSPIPADDVLAQVTLVDESEPAQPTCQRPAFVGGDDNGNDLLDREPFETWTYTCAAVIDAPTTNVAGVGAFGGTQLQPPLEVVVIDFDAAFVQTFDPGIDVVKTADPSQLPATGGDVTYRYQVTNAGDVPLADVAARISDDTCAPVTFVDGDVDGDGLLDTPDSIFEDSLDETWTFTCTTAVSVDTVNTVTVTGTPTDPSGVELCGPDDPDAIAGRSPVAEPCDVDGTDTATVVVRDTATLVVEKITDVATTQTFDFTLDGTGFVLESGATRPTDLAPGTYLVTEQPAAGWFLVGVSCDDPTAVTDPVAGTASVELERGEVVTCTFTNQSAGQLPATGAVLVQRLATIAAGLALAGAIAWLISRRRRPITAG